MDSETYNDLISCIVGHAQRLRDQNPKDASPAMVQKKKQGMYYNFDYSDISEALNFIYRFFVTERIKFEKKESDCKFGTSSFQCIHGWRCSWH
jgi:hypothetical protein